VDINYSDDEAVCCDAALVEYWKFRCAEHYTRGLPALSKETLVDQLTHGCFTVTAGHQVVGDIVQYVTIPNGMCFQVRPDHNMMDARQMTNVLSITASTGRQMPLLREDWSHLLASPNDNSDQRLRYKELHRQLVQDLTAVSHAVQERCKEQPVAFTELDPLAFECSVSI